MTTNALPQDRRELAAAFAAATGAILAPATVRGEGPLAAAAETGIDVLPISRGLREAAAGALTGADDLQLATAEVQLLAGAALDLMLAGNMVAPATAGLRALTAGPSGADDLRAIIAAPEAYLAGALAGVSLRGETPRRVRALSADSAGLATASHVALTSIRDNLVSSGGRVVEGLLLMDAALLKEALGVVGADIGKKLGVDLISAAGRAVLFVLAANDKILSLVGYDGLKLARRQLAAWIAQLNEGTLLPNLAERLLKTKAIEEEIAAWLEAYRGDAAVMPAAQAEIATLTARYAAKMRIADKVTAGLALVKIAPPLMTPVGRIAVAASYIGLLAYVIGSGYDHADSDRIKLLNRVEGVRGVSRRVLRPGQ